MSKLIEKLSKLSRSVTQPIGFHSAISETSSSSLLLIAAISSINTINIKSLVNSPIDAMLILDPKVTLTNTKKFIELSGDIPLGLVIDQLNTTKVDDYSRIGLDFIAFNKSSSMTAMQLITTGKLFIIDSTINIDLVKAINSMGIDGALIDNSKIDSLNIEHLLICRRLHEILRKPLLMMVSSVITDYELRQLWETGIAGVVFPDTWTSESVERLRQAANNLPKRNVNRMDKPEAILPHYTEDVALDEDDDEDEE
jgi:hypothetical protein